MFLHVVAHTHWDREWYHPVERFRQRLVALVDELIDDPPRDDESFLLDGQTIVLEDYLAVRPDRAEALYDLLRSGRIEAGPWFVLADELIPSGEALIRNLLTGRRMLRRVGVEAPPVLYCPDSFGHPAALPSIAAGFGLPLIILWRGFGGKRWPSGDVVRWAAPSGDEALIYHLPRDGYEFGSHLPIDPAESAARWKRMREELAPRSATGVALIPNGADHHARQLGQREAVAALAAAAAPDDVRPSSLRAFSDAIVAAVRSTGSALPVIRGELRDSYGYTWTIQGTFGTRAHEKRMNARAERLLLRDAEPWAALAARVGPSKRPLIELAWRTLLEAHPHDTLCGCSIDEVADAMELRIRSATNQAEGIRDDSIVQLIGHDPVEARDSRDRWTPVVLVRNPAARARSGIAIVDFETFVADVAVGPGSGTATSDRKAEPMTFDGRDPVQVIDADFTHRLTESARHYPDNDLVSIARMAMWVESVPGYGIVPLRIARRSADRVLAGAQSLENAHCRVQLDDKGTVLLEDKRTGRRITSLIEPVSEDDIGDTYTPAPRPPTHTVTFDNAELTHSGPLIGQLELRYHLRAGAESRMNKVQQARANRLAKMPLWRQRSRENGHTAIVLRLQLHADAPWLRVEVEGENHTEDHRLRLRLRTDVKAGEVWADAAFGPVRREPIVVPPEDSAMEIPPRTAPLHRYVSVFAGDRGATVFSDGLAEYEAADDGSVLITLVRSVGELSVNDLPERPGNAGWPKHTPGAQCIGPFNGSFAIMLHDARSPETVAAIEHAADDVLLPLRGTTLRSALRVPDPVDGVELAGIGLGVSAIKESEDGQWLVLRCVNLLDVPVAGSWRIPFDVTEARLARLDETLIEGLSTIDRVIAFESRASRNRHYRRSLITRDRATSSRPPRPNDRAARRRAAYTRAR